MRAFVLTLLSLAAAPAIAHPGDHHGNLLTTVWHLVSEPDHLALILIALVVGVAGALIQRRRER